MSQSLVLFIVYVFVLSHSVLILVLVFCYSVFIT